MRELVIILVLCAAVIATLWNFAVLNSGENDQQPSDQDLYGILEAEETGQLSARLIECSEDQNCPEYAQALFWVAVDILSNSSAETIELEGRDFGITPEMSIEEMTDIVAPQLDEMLGIYPTPPKYDFADPEYKRGLELLNKAHDAGSVYASNELGLLFFDRGKMQDLDLAEKYFSSAWEKGDSNGVYNLARLKRAQDPSKHEEVLGLLKLAAQGGREDLQVMYLLGLEAFGDSEMSSAATMALKPHKAELSRLRAEFNFQFGIIEIE